MPGFMDLSLTANNHGCWNVCRSLFLADGSDVELKENILTDPVEKAITNSNVCVIMVAETFVVHYF